MKVTGFLISMFVFGLMLVMAGSADAVEFVDYFDRPDSTDLGNGWTEVQGDLIIQDNEVRNEAIKIYHMAVQELLLGEDQDVSADFSSANNDGGSRFGIIVRYQDPQNYYLFYRNMGATSRFVISRIEGGVETILGKKAGWNTRNWFNLRAVAEGTTLRLEADGVEKVSLEDDTFAAGTMGFLMGSPSRLRIHEMDNFSTTYTSATLPLAQFYGLPTSGDTLLTVDFTDLSICDITSWSWDFGDGGTSTEQNPTYIYQDEGTYTVSLTVTSSEGTDTKMRIDYITATAPPVVADFFAIPTEGWDEYYTAEFVSMSIGPIDDYLWDFGDGTSSTEMAASHKYAEPGIYTVTLTVSCPEGSDSMVKVDYITVKDFDAEYAYPDYVLTTATQGAFDAALDTIEASQTPYETYPDWCAANWCSAMQYGGGGRILFDDSIAASTFYVNWDGRIDPRGHNNNSNGKRDFFGDNLIIDGQSKNIKFYYNGTQNCGQAENRCALRIHGNDNIIRNITWDRFPDGLHMRAGQRNLVEGVTTNIVCEDALTFNGSGNSCVDCTARDCTYGASNDKTVTLIAGSGYYQNAPSRLVISGMLSTNSNKPIRFLGNDNKSLVVVRNGTFVGDTAGSKFGGENNLLIFENNYARTSRSGSGGIVLREKIRVLIRNNTFENSPSGYGIYAYNDGAYARIENNTIQNNGAGGVIVPGGNMDLGGGLVDIYINGMLDGPGTVPVPSVGRNTIKNNGGYDLINESASVVKAENNSWDNSTVATVLANDVDGAADVDPLEVDID